MAVLDMRSARQGPLSRARAALGALRARNGAKQARKSLRSLSTVALTDIGLCHADLEIGRLTRTL